MELKKHRNVQEVSQSLLVKYGGAHLTRHAEFKSILQDLGKRYSTVNVVFKC